MPRWSVSGEEGLIRRIRRIFSAPPLDVRVPIGDDAALIRLASGADLAITTDQLVEGVHFRIATHPPELLGARALTVNLSDLTSLGAEPRWFLLSLFLSPDVPGDYLEGVLRGMAREARRRRVFLVGGNLTAAPGLALDIALAGTIPAGRKPMLRSGARTGDSLYVTGALGGSALGLELLGEGWRWRRGRARLRGAPLRVVESATRALRSHLSPSPDYRVASLLSRHRLASAAIDISDGLSTDLSRLCAASRVGARLWESCLPVDPAAAHLREGDRALELALHGGEGYQLLFAIPPSREPRLRRLARVHPPACIGVLVPAREGVLLENPEGRTRPLRAGGYDHLRRRSSRTRRSSGFLK